MIMENCEYLRHIWAAVSHINPRLTHCAFNYFGGSRPHTFTKVFFVFASRYESASRSMQTHETVRAVQTFHRFIVSSDDQLEIHCEAPSGHK